jgi:UDP-N-acetylglucosamine 2-epimerase (non-hydrolysing)
LGKPCVTIRKNTERPITITEGTNILMDLHNEDFLSFVQTHQDNLKKAHLNPIKFWDNKVSDRILDVIKQCRVKK